MPEDINPQRLAIRMLAAVAKARPLDFLKAVETLRKRGELTKVDTRSINYSLRLVMKAFELDQRAKERKRTKARRTKH